MEINQNKYIIKVKFDKIEINPANSRHNIMLDEETAALWLIDESISDMISLIVSFIDNGFLPIPFAVIKKEDEDKYVALDGNRRLTALKLLSGKISLPDARKYYQLKELVDNNRIADTSFFVDCLIYDTEEEASPYIISLHQSGGVIPGQKKWTPLQQNRYAERHSKAVDNWYVFVDTYLNNDEIESLKQPTTLNRLINNEKFGKLFQMDSSYHTKLDDEFMKTIVRKIVSDMNDGTINSRKLNTALQVEAYIFDLAMIFGLVESKEPEMPNKDQLSIVDLPFEETESAAKETRSPIKNSTTPNRRTVIPTYVNLSGVNTKINYLNNDLKSLDVYRYKATCAIGLRVLVEMLTKLYMQKNGMKTDVELKKESPLHSDISTVLNHMRTKGIISDHLHSQCIAYVNKQQRIVFLNGCVHHLDVNPDSENLIELFDTLEEYLKICAKQS